MEYNLQEGVKRINSIAPEHMSGLCDCVIKGLIDSKQTNQIFSEEKSSQLCTAFSMDRISLLLMIDTLFSIYREAAMLRLAKKIIPYLQQLGIADTHVK